MLNIAYLNEDRIIFSELLQSYETALEGKNILQMNIDRILDRDDINHYNNYRFPIIRKRISKGESSSDLSQWLKRIIKTETDIKIIDGYIYQERENFKNYFLPHISHKATIKIYTFLDHISQSDVINKFTGADYSNFNIEVFLIPSKRDQHARNILTNSYFIHLEKGLRIFGRNGQTDQSDITVDYITNITGASFPPVSGQIV